jgi:hypothetical protein
LSFALALLPRFDIRSRDRCSVVWSARVWSARRWPSEWNRRKARCARSKGQAAADCCRWIVPAWQARSHKQRSTRPGEVARTKASGLPALTPRMSVVRRTRGVSRSDPFAFVALWSINSGCRRHRSHHRRRRRRRRRHLDRRRSRHHHRRCEVHEAWLRSPSAVGRHDRAH